MSNRRRTEVREKSLPLKGLSTLSHQLDLFKTWQVPEWFYPHWRVGGQINRMIDGPLYQESTKLHLI